MKNRKNQRKTHNEGERATQDWGGIGSPGMTGDEKSCSRRRENTEGKTGWGMRSKPPHTQHRDVVEFRKVGDNKINNQNMK